MGINTVQTIDDLVTVNTVLVSVFDKTGLDVFIPGLVAVNPRVRIISTGATYAAVAKILGTGSAAALQQVADYTGQPEMQGGLVKTLDFKIYLGLLSETYNAAHADDLRRTGAATIDMVVSNLYPFAAAVAAADATPETARGNIDIGGPCMVRAAAKNFHRVAAVTDSSDYAGVVQALKAGGGALALPMRFALAQKAFRMIASYDSAISAYLDKQSVEEVRRCYAMENPA